MGRAFEVRKASMAKTSAAKSKVYSRFGKEIYIAAKQGVPDPEMNLSLKRLIDKAKKEQVPADIIKRAIDKAKSGVDENYTPSRYEGFGPIGTAMIIVDCLTDNVNRTVADVRNCFTKSQSKMGVSGSVSHMYNHTSIFSFKGLSEEETLETLLMADVDVDDIESEEDIVTVYASPQDFYKIKTTLDETGSVSEYILDEITWIPQNYTELEGEELQNFQKLLNMLNELDDVQQVYHNVSNV